MIESAYFKLPVVDVGPRQQGRLHSCNVIHCDYGREAVSQAIQRALVMLQNLPRGQRAARMNSPAFRNRFSPDEQKIVADLSEAWLLPPMQSSPQAIPK